MIGNNFVLWKDEKFVVKTPFNPHTPYSEGLHIVVTTEPQIATAWEDPELSGQTFALASRVSKILVSTGMAPWVNLQANAN